MKMKMLGRVTAFAALAVMLCGCSTWESTMSGLGLYGPEDVAASPSAPSAASPSSASPDAARAHPMLRNSELAADGSHTQMGGDWCRQAAEQDREMAAENGFDKATQQRRYLVSYRQCTAMQDGTGQ